MVSVIKYLRNCVPILGMIALAMLFLKLPGLSNVSSVQCKSCVSVDPYMPLAGSGYIAILLALSFLFPTFPNNSHIARGGLIWAVALAFFLTYTHLPSVCWACLAAHACHIMMWGIWYGIPAKENPPNVPIGTRLYLLLVAPVLAASLFSSLNLTFITYAVKSPSTILSLKAGDRVPGFQVKTIAGETLVNTDAKKLVLNFISPGCHYCKEQMQILSTLKFDPTYRLINITPALTPELLQSSAAAEWIEDKDHHLHRLFKIQGSPTMYIVGANGTIVRTILGLPKHFKDDLQICLADIN